MGVDPDPYTLRQLVWMAEGRRRDQWDHTASLLSLFANAHRDVKKRRSPFSPDDFHPFAAGRKRSGSGTRITPANISLLRVFVPPKAEPCDGRSASR